MVTIDVKYRLLLANQCSSKVVNSQDGLCFLIQIQMANFNRMSY
ncbi:hypothetical protein BTN50_1670 (plasmid) [Candidatus Enterovibrio altilux]|uniref:Uncharacterized protein n=1 Tax=Candidatus Enterovibrio altilux TaxID=1927128 RepID=A0A291BAS2_9GAMM|nr:hypothetical protein BTN50_1670 [Candidatus Enterovibrio luxaltus]